VSHIFPNTNLGACYFLPGVYEKDKTSHGISDKLNRSRSHMQNKMHRLSHVALPYDKLRSTFQKHLQNLCFLLRELFLILPSLPGIHAFSNNTTFEKKIQVSNNWKSEPTRHVKIASENKLI
jgi:hypothetical protein